MERKIVIQQMKAKLDTKFFREDQHRLIFMWVKEEKINLKEFSELINYIK